MELVFALDSNTKTKAKNEKPEEAEEEKKMSLKSQQTSCSNGIGRRNSLPLLVSEFDINDHLKENLKQLGVHKHQQNSLWSREYLSFL